MKISKAAPNTTAGARNWQRQGNCASVDPDVMFPSKPEDIAKARAVCVGCPVYRLCLRNVIRTEGAKHVDSRDGVVAGLTGPERFNAYRILKRRGQLK